MITITGWGAFWLGLFGFLALSQLALIIKMLIKTHTLTKIVKHITNLDPELLKELNKDD